VVDTLKPSVESCRLCKHFEKDEINCKLGITKVKGEYKYIMDFDAYAENVDPDNFLFVTDELRMLDRSEFLSNITEDFKQYMRE
jgi:hypothetical protein